MVGDGKRTAQCEWYWIWTCMAAAAVRARAVLGLFAER